MNLVDVYVKDNNMFLKGEIVGVATSGGADSMVLLHYLFTNKKKFGIKEVVAVTIDHGIREESKNDADFVVSYCNKNDIKVYLYKTTLEELTSNKKLTLEQSAREFRYRCFEELLSKGVVNKIALAHHLQDQVETILLNIFRGTGLSGASGMKAVRSDVYVRPMLKVTKTEILAYIGANNIPYVEDQSNQDNAFSRNYIRNLVMPLIRTKWSNADSAIAAFGEVCKQDDEYILNSINYDGIIKEDYNTIKLPLSYFAYDESVLYRVIIKALKEINAVKDLERKHLLSIIALAKRGENGRKINLPDKLVAYKEYNFIVLSNRDFKPVVIESPFAVGKIDIPNFGVIETVRLRKPDFENYKHIVDIKKVPKRAVWRFRKDGDMFEKFGGGTKLLSDYLTDIKVPRRLRNTLPVLAMGDEILIVGGYEISEKLKVDEKTKTVYGINAVEFKY